MAYAFNTPNLTNGIDGTLADVSGSVGSFIPMLFLFVYAVVLFGGSAAQYRRTGTSDIPLWSTIAGLSVTSLALFFTLSPGIIGKTTLSVVIVITLLSGLWLFLSKNRNEI